MELGKIIDEYRSEHGMSVVEFAEKSGLSKSYIYMIRDGKRFKGDVPVKPTFDVVKKIASAMHMTPNELMLKMQGSETQAVKRGTLPIPVLGRVAAGNPIVADENILGKIEVPERFAKSGEVFGLKIKGNSMYPEIKDGDIVVVRKQDFFEDKNICIVRINGEDATCKRVVREKNGLWLIPINPEYERKFFTKEEVENLPVEIVGKVFEVRRTYA